MEKWRWPYIDPMTKPAPVEIGPARHGDLAAVRTLLTQSGLPAGGLEDLGDTLLVARSGRRIVGSAALELYPPAALLRSVAVDATLRGTGLGVRLTEAALALAVERGIARVYLLTETAGEFFPKFGFRTVTRDEVDPAVKESQEFSSLCPESAQVMMLDLAEWTE